MSIISRPIYFILYMEGVSVNNMMSSQEELAQTLIKSLLYRGPSTHVVKVIKRVDKLDKIIRESHLTLSEQYEVRDKLQIVLNELPQRPTWSALKVQKQVHYDSSDERN